MTRISTSGEPPAADGMTKRTGFSGYAASAAAPMSHDNKRSALRTPQGFGGIHGEVREDAVRAGALEGKQRLEHARLRQPTLVDRAPQHRIFARHLINVGR